MFICGYEVLFLVVVRGRMLLLGMIWVIVFSVLFYFRLRILF